MSVLRAEQVRSLSVVPVRQWIGLALLAASLGFLLVTPIRTAPDNIAKECGKVTAITATPRVATDRGWIARLTEEQRLEATCEDAAMARVFYLAPATLAFATALWRASRTSASSISRILLLVFGIVVLAAAIVDGPLLPLALGSLGAGVSVWTHRALATRRVNASSSHPPSAT